MFFLCCKPDAFTVKAISLGSSKCSEKNHRERSNEQEERGGRGLEAQL